MGRGKGNVFFRINNLTLWYREADKKSVFGNISLNKKDRDKNKLLEVVTKQLRGLVQQTTS